MYTYRHYVPHLVVHWSGTSFVGALYVMPVVGLLLCSEKLNRIKCPPIELLGKASYHIFLFQMFFYQFITYPIQVRFADAPTAILLFVSIAVCVSCGLLFWVIETRVSKWIRKGISAMNLRHLCQRARNYVNTKAVR